MVRLLIVDDLAALESARSNDFPRARGVRFKLAYICMDVINMYSKLSHVGILAYLKIDSPHTG